MSMRIHNDGIAAAAAPPPPPVENVAQHGSSLLGAPIANTGGDQVEISSLSGSVSSSVGALAEQQTARVSQLAALYASGGYQVDSMQISRALVSAAIAAGPAGEDS